MFLLFIEHRHCCVNVFIRMLNFRSWSQPRTYFNSEISSIYVVRLYQQMQWPLVALTLVLVRGQSTLIILTVLEMKVISLTAHGVPTSAVTMAI